MIQQQILTTFTAIIIYYIITPTFTYGGLIESERLEEYHARNYTWPVLQSNDLRYRAAKAAGIHRTLYKPDTEGWANLMDRRLSQVGAIRDSNARYNAWLSVITSAVVAPNFTESGWGLTKAPQFLVDELKERLHEGLAARPGLERDVDVIEGATMDSKPLFIHIGGLTSKTLRVLKPMHEAWSGVPLVGSIAYGLRVYRNASSLNMHVDKSHTHVISCILHVDHDDDPESEPWPIYIEDFQGNTNEVILESGDMLFYESSKCIHGRPKEFKGKWYSSLFVHYHPENWDKSSRELESHYAVPMEWAQEIPANPGLPDLEMVGTSMKEPSCINKWCLTEDAVVWGGLDVAEYGKVIDTTHPEGREFTYRKSKIEIDAIGDDDEEL